MFLQKIQIPNLRAAWIPGVLVSSLLLTSGCAVSTQSGQVSASSQRRPVPIQEMHRPAPASAQRPSAHYPDDTGSQPRTSSNSGAASLLQQAAQARAAGNYARAQTLAERAQTLEPRQGYSYLELARIYREQGDISRSRQMALRGLSVAGGDPALQRELQELSNP